MRRHGHWVVGLLLTAAACGNSSTTGDMAVDAPMQQGGDMVGVNNSGDMAGNNNNGDGPQVTPDLTDTTLNNDDGGGPLPDLVMQSTPDLMPVCTAGSACANGSSNGLCNSSNACVGCVDTSDDANCKTAYGTTAAPSYLCIGGSCVVGNCRVDSDCPMGQICGLSTPNLCAPCTTDAACQRASYGKSFVCNGSGQCVSGACTSGNDTACSQNAADVCCASACVPGSCCDTAYCHTSKGNNYTCLGNVCTLCDPTMANTYFVDPAAGDDTTATGSGKAAGATSAACSFKTIARALQVIGAPNAPTRIVVMATGGVGAGEKFPILLPANVTLSSMGGPVTITVPSGQTGILLAGASSGITGPFTFDGQKNVAQTGIAITGGSASLSTLTVQNFLGDGILVTGGTVSITSGVTSSGNGTATARHAGLHITGKGSVTINNPSGGVPDAFNGNSSHGILVDTSGQLTLTGAPGAAGAGTVTTSQNYVAGLWMQQSNVASAPASSITGLVCFGNTNGNGVRILAGSNVKVRKTVSLGNAGSGMLVSTAVVGKVRVNDVSKIDLGTATDAGGNTFQASLGQNPNLGTGICMSADANAGALSAAGNVFSGGRDCSMANAGKLTLSAACGGHTDVGVMGAGNSINAASCTY